MAFEMKSVYSSHIDSIGYDPDTKILYVEYSNGTSGAYGGVPEDVARDVVYAPSIGSAIHSLVRGRYQFSYEDVNE